MGKIYLKTQVKFDVICVKKFFKKQADFLKHKKEKHIELIQTCRNVLSGNFSYGDSLCCFKHESGEELKKLEKQMVIIKKCLTKYLL